MPKKPDSKDLGVHDVFEDEDDGFELGLEHTADFDDFDDFDTETAEVTEEVARRFAESMAPAALHGMTLLPAAFERDFDLLPPERRQALLDALGLDTEDVHSRGVTLLPPSTAAFATAMGPDAPLLSSAHLPPGQQATLLSFDTVLHPEASERPASQRTTLRPLRQRGTSSTSEVWEADHSWADIAPPWADPQPVASPEAPPREERHGERFIDLGRIGSGGMGEVRRVFDRSLKRVLAMKILLPDFVAEPSVISRFVSEAQATGQLQHPGIVPVHEMGRLADGRWFFTMREVRGEHLGKVLADAAHARQHNEATNWDLRHLVGVFHKVCEAVGYAHTRQVIHRDLKPENILIGDHGEVLVVDWGIARVLDGRAEPSSTHEDVVTTRSEHDGRKTMVGAIAGTPSYMPPEQARGDRDIQGPASDVYALGAILYEILSGAPPYREATPNATIKALLAGPPPPLPLGTGIPEALRAICLRALEREPAARYPSARDLARLVAAWLDGAQRRQEALELMARANAKQGEVAKLRERVRALYDESRQLLNNTPPLAPVHLKQPAWEIAERARRLEHGADVLEVAATHHARAALERDDTVDEAYAVLSDMYRAAHEAAEWSGQTRVAERNLLLLRAHHRGRHQAYLSGEGAVTLITDPPGAEVEIFRYEVRDRRVQLVPTGLVYTSPLVAVTLPFGSYALEVRVAGAMPVTYPVYIGREEHWDGVPPGASEPFPIHIPSRSERGTDDVYVPAGYFWSGGDRRAPNATDRERVWVDGFLIQRFPVSMREYLEFLEHLVKARRDTELEELLPAPLPGVGGAMPFAWSRHGVVQAPQDAQGKPVGLELPILGVHWSAAMAYARWWRDEDMGTWRLPHEIEWEKAARGVDGRAFPFGPHLDPTWACMGESHAEYLLPAKLRDFASDVGPYGVRGMAGNARDWCRNQYHPHDLDVVGGRLEAERIRPQSDGPVYRATRGGTWSATVDECRVATRGRRPQDERLADGSIRLVRSVVGGSPS